LAVGERICIAPRPGRSLDALAALEHTEQHAPVRIDFGSDLSSASRPVHAPARP